MDNMHDGLLLRYMAGEASPEERERVQDWLAQSDDNKKHFRQLKQIWGLSYVAAPAAPDVEAAWLRLQQKTSGGQARSWKHARILLPLPAAALLLLLIAAGALFYFVQVPAPTPVSEVATQSVEEPPSVVTSASETDKPTVMEEDRQPDALPGTKPLASSAASPQHLDRKEQTPEGKKVKEAIVNQTLCPIEICIVQTVHCSNNRASAYAHCSLLQPDHSGQLHYAMFEGASVCEAMVDEISIKRTSTGETIILNAHSPVTAQEFFDYLTGKKTGRIEAGVFEADCDNYCLNESIKLDNSLGNLVIN